MRRIALVVSLLLAAQAAAAEDFQGFAVAEAAVARAAKVCPGIAPDMGQLAYLRGLTVADSDEADFAAALRAADAKVMRGLQTSGRAKWCAGILEAFGPDGSIVPDLIRRLP